MTTPPERLDPHIAQAASEWFARLSDASATDDDRRAWLQWRNAYPAHEQAWQQVEKVVRKFHLLDPSAAQQALRRPASAPATTRRHALQSLAVAGVAVGAGYMGLRQLPWGAWTADYHTATGEQREFTLADGTRLMLNTATAVNVAFDSHTRRVELVRGEIHIATAPDYLSRRFVVATPLAELLPVGTRFSVRQEQDWVRLTVHQGAVDATQAHNTLRVAAGASVQITRNGLGEATASPDNAESWTQGMLLADGMPLAEFTAELARHRTGRLVCDPSVADLRLSGAFPLRDTDAALAAVARALPVRLASMTRLWVRIEPR